ncbi:hypothetical protein NIES4075_44530 [Tolypothrix sp. NIES-4075]|uniref:hypothetical protein n=1 Tax=Tolypothrix sp. NIES-4075 TaxID=2005459 RepID=UPI000B5C6E03|nr:hypothetical protein [Tolypothrix sp. NIES-4075]GAX43440.1 hypothetical protein NIES4075_44530 [Tolypothrix sp. NIES-4075]
MSYCANKTKAVVKFNFSDKKEKIFESEKVPIEVIAGLADDTLKATVNYSNGFPGEQLQTFNFTIDAPSDVPQGLQTPPEIYLVSGYWDDWGTIGNYSTGYGIIKSYGGNSPPIKIGTGYSVKGTVVNVRPYECFARCELQWRWGGCKIIISSQGMKLYEETGDCPVNFKVSCDDDCPEGTMKCEIPQYPGYCCLPCETKSEIAALTALVRNINHG